MISFRVVRPAPIDRSGPTRRRTSEAGCQRVEVPGRDYPARSRPVWVLGFGSWIGRDPAFAADAGSFAALGGEDVGRAHYIWVIRR
jgi:hypothetical protein